MIYCRTEINEILVLIGAAILAAAILGISMNRENTDSPAPAAPAATETQEVPESEAAEETAEAPAATETPSAPATGNDGSGSEYVGMTEEEALNAGTVKQETVESIDDNELLFAEDFEWNSEAGGWQAESTYGDTMTMLPSGMVVISPNK